MRLTKRAQASRANGARSHGPITAAGKLRSSSNALRHGLLSKCVVLPNESQEIFDLLLDQHLSKFQPADEVERGLVDQMVASMWRADRLMAIETRLLKNAMNERTGADELDRIAGAFSELAQRPELNLIQRYEGRLHRTYQRALQNLFLLSDSDPDNDPNSSPQPDPKTPPDQTNPSSSNPNIVNSLEPRSKSPQPAAQPRSHRIPPAPPQNRPYRPPNCPVPRKKRRR